MAIVMGVTRGTSKDTSVWSITFATFATIIGLIIPQIYFGTMVFITGMLAYYVSFMPIIKKINNVNIFHLAYIAIAINIILSISMLAYMNNLGTESNQNLITSKLNNIILNQDTGGSTYELVDTGLCQPEDVNCETQLQKGTTENDNFDLIGGILNIAGILGKGIALIAYASLGTAIVGTQLILLISNPVIAFLVGMALISWNLAIVYNIVKFVLNKRGV
jgi:hypothetical protein